MRKLLYILLVISTNGRNLKSRFLSAFGMTTLLLLLFVMARNEAISQNRKIDSLVNCLKTDKEDTNRITHLNLLSREYFLIGSYDTAAVLANQALVIAEAVIAGNDPQSQQPDGGSKPAMTNSVKLAMTKGKATAYNNLGSVNYLQGNYPKALDYFLKALKIDEELKDKKGMAKRLGNIGNVYYNQADYPKALEYYSKALKMAEELGDKNGIAVDLGNIGVVYMDQADYPKALNYYFKALKMSEELGNKNLIASWLGNIGIVYQNQADYPKALTYYFKALKMREELGNKIGIAINLGNIGALYTKTGKFKKAEEYLKKSISITSSIGSLDYWEFEEKLSHLYDTTGRHKEALIEYKKAIVLKDTIFSEENKKSLIRKEMNYQYEKKGALMQAEQDKKDAIAEEEKQKQQLFLVLVSCILVLVSVFSVFIYRTLRITRKQKHIIELQKEEVERQKQLVDTAYKQLHEKNEEVMASIRYAKRIQDAFMTSQKYIARELNRLFSLRDANKAKNKPKD